MLGCLKPERTTGGSVVENEILAGILLAENGDPVDGVEVCIYRVDHVPGESGDAAYSTRTDAGGQYAVDTLSRGEYNILGSKDGRVSYRDSVFLTPDQRTEVRDTLRDPGSIAGVVGLQPGDDPRSVTVHVLGTQVFVNVDEDGRFELEGLAGGEYRLRVESTLDDYVPLFRAMRIRSGRSDTLADTLEIPYTVIPLVPGIDAGLDTLAGIATIRWEHVPFRNFKNYVVVRSIRGSLLPTSVIVGMPTDNVFLDTLFPGKFGDYGLA